jgi:hypothetical protein
MLGAKRMNEIELIKGQLRVERQHAEAVARACASGLASDLAFRAAGIEYLAWILTRFEEREQVFHDLVRRRLATNDPHRLGVEVTLASPGSNREALAKLETALGTGTDVHTSALRWGEFLSFFCGPWVMRRDEIERLFQIQAKVTDWRTLSAIDADSIVAERTRWARVKATMPADAEPPSNTRRV